jgi:SAM-dependent methyltransferase
LGSDGQIGARIVPTSSEIAAAIEPYVLRRVPVASAEWRGLYGQELKDWRRRLWRRRWKAFSLKSARPQKVVREKYSKGWQKQVWPSPALEDAPVRICRWHDEGLFVRLGGTKRVHEMLLARTLKELRPRSVLEVGCGNGLNLLALSTGFPGVRWAGLELAPAGVAKAKAAQQEPTLPAKIAAFCSWPNVAPDAYREIDFREGDARKLPFADRSFDVVFSALALEQMEAIRDAAVAEMARVAAKWVVFVEPFADFNRDPVRHAYTRAKGYFSLTVGELTRFGLEPVAVFDDMPHKITIGYGLVVARVKAAA